jgi:DNA-binding MarR family transcriptional regulator
MKNQLYDIDESIGHLVGRISRLLLLRLFREFKRLNFDITPEMFIVLGTLKKQDGLSQVFLAEKVEKDMPTISRIIDNLEKRNLVVRIPDTNDRRNKKVYMTRLGKETQDKLQVISLGLWDILQGEIPDEEFETCKQTLRKVYINLKTQNTQS